MKSLSSIMVGKVELNTDLLEVLPEKGFVGFGSR